MKPLQQDDIQDSLNEGRKSFWFIHKPSGKHVRAEDKAQANMKFRKQHGIQSKRIDVKQANNNERPKEL